MKLQHSLLAIKEPYQMWLFGTYEKTPGSTKLFLILARKALSKRICETYRVLVEQ